MQLFAVPARAQHERRDLGGAVSSSATSCVVRAVPPGLTSEWRSAKPAASLLHQRSPNEDIDAVEGVLVGPRLAAATRGRMRSQIGPTFGDAGRVGASRMGETTAAQ